MTVTTIQAVTVGGPREQKLQDNFFAVIPECFYRGSTLSRRGSMDSRSTDCGNDGCNASGGYTVAGSSDQKLYENFCAVIPEWLYRGSTLGRGVSMDSCSTDGGNNVNKVSGG